MGWFSSTYEYYSFVGSTDLFGIEDRPDTLKEMILQSVLMPNGTSSSYDAIMLTVNTDLYARARSIMRYARRDYARGLPSTDQTNVGVPSEALTQAIANETGQEIHELSTVRKTSSADINFLMQKSIKEGYTDPTVFDWPEGDPQNPVWDQSRETIEIPVSNPLAEPGGSPYYVVENSPRYVRENLNPEGEPEYWYQLYFSYEDTNGNPARYVLSGNYRFEAEYTGKDMIYVRYKNTADTSLTHYWMYEVGSGRIPELEEDFEFTTMEAEFMPIIVMMRDRKWYDEHDGSDLSISLEESTIKMCKKLMMKAEDVKEDFITQVEEDPDLDFDQIWDFYIHWGVPLRTFRRGGREYIYHFIHYLETTQTSTRQDFEWWLSSGGLAAAPENIFRISEQEVETEENTGFNVEYAYAYCYTTTKPGQYHPPGAAEPLAPNRMYSEVKFGGDTRARYKELLEEIHGTGTPIGTSAGDNDYAAFVKQHYDYVTDTYTHTWAIMMGPSMRYEINTAEISEGENANRTRYAVPELFPQEEGASVREFRLPVHWDSLKEVMRMQREGALAEALTATVFVVQELKKKWYQKRFFKWLIIIIVIIVVVVTWRYELLLYLWQAAGAALAVGATATALAYYAAFVALSFAIGFMISFAGGLIGGTWGKVFVIVASLMVAGINPFSNVAASWGTMTTQFSWGSAMQFLNAVQPFLNVAKMIYTEVSLRNLEKDYEEWLLTAREKQEELDRAYAGLDIPSNIDPMTVVNSFAYAPVEQPSDFVTRSTMLNPGVLGYDLIENFTELAVRLPEFPGEQTVIDGLFATLARQRGAV
jgi:hypothetical protein